MIVPRLGRAEVAAPPIDGRVEVRLGAMHATVPIGDVLLDSHRRAQRDEPAAPRTDKDELGSPPLVLIDGAPAGGGKSGARTIETTIDVRGHRVDDALVQVERFVDESLLAGRRRDLHRAWPRHRRAAHRDPAVTSSSASGAGRGARRRARRGRRWRRLSRF